ncbi:class I SAM-dependent methyltransferase [Octadecabacter sp.]|nr:class I SAM-dependent methyltransferase [Octadecabacter sp.]
MHLDVHDLREFYYRSPLGRAAQKVVRDELVRAWPNTKGETVAGFGFAVPLLRPFLKPSRRVISLMPGPQGVMPWPAGGPNVSVLCEDTLWPLGSGMVDKLVLLHGLETSDHPLALLDECWRVLTPNGRAMFVVPNRAGLWSRSDATPFGFGRPYSLGQLERQLRETGLIPTKTLSVLYQPPSSRKVWRRLSSTMERAGRNLPVFTAGGVLMVEVTKQIPQPKRPGLTEAVKRPLRVLEGMGGPVVKPV